MDAPPDTGRPARIIALINQKGGVGKTTTAVNLAAGLARLGRRCLLVDLDPQEHSTLHLGVESPERSIYDVLLDPASAKGAVVAGRPGLDLIAGRTDLAAAEAELAAEADRATRLRAGLSTVAGAYDAIMIDCPPSLGLLTLNGLAAARKPSMSATTS